MAAATGAPIPNPITIMNTQEVFIRRGQLTMIAAAPGCGKSAIAQAILQRGNDAGAHATVLYFSADSDQMTMWTRSAAIASGYDTSTIERTVKAGNGNGLMAEVRRDTGHMEFVYHSAPSDEDVLLEVEAYAVKYGVYPDVIVMDNLMNLYAGDGGEFEALQGNCDFLHNLARQTSSAVITLHHVTGEYEDGARAIPLSGIRGKVTKTPEMILTLYRQGEQMFICPVKQRSGRADPSGGWKLPVFVDLARMSFM